MLGQAMEYLAIRPDGVYLDATAGLGGHTRAIAERLTTGIVLASDRDTESLERARENTVQFAPRIRYHPAAFSRLGEALAAENIKQLDGLLADLGVSRYQLTTGERGFSLMADGPLDMRMDRSQGQTAADIVNFESEQELANLIYRLGEERRSRKIARAIVRARPISTTGQLAKLIEQVSPGTGRQRIHPATQTFQALRMAVNGELEELSALIESIPRLVKAGGRAVVITFHSLEDRMVKQGFQAMARDGQARILTRHVVRPDEEEIRSNAQARSAKLRAVEIRG